MSSSISFRIAVVAFAALIPLAPDASSRGIVERSLAIKGVRVVTPGMEAQDGATVVVKDGVIRGVLKPGEEASIPYDARVLDGTGLTVAPAFLDAWSAAFSAERPKKEAERSRTIDEGVRIGMDPDTRIGRTPEYRTELAMPWKDAKKWREAGFGAFLAVPQGTGIRGQSIAGWLVEEGATAPEATLARDVFLHADLSISGPGYPSTLMGVLAAYRQFFADASRNAALWARYEKSLRKVERPALDVALSDLETSRARGHTFVFRADSAREIRTAIAFAEEHGLAAGIAGGAESDEVIAELKAVDAIVLLGIDFPKPADEPEAAGSPENPGSDDHAVHDERGVCDDCMSGAEASLQDPPAKQAVQDPGNGKDVTKVDAPADKAPDVEKTDKPDDPTKTDEPGKDPKADKPEKKKSDLPPAVIAERDAKRAQRIATASKLAAANVSFAITAKDLKDPADFRKNLKLAIDAGLSKDAALAAATAGAAEIVGLGGVLGKVEAGHLAALALYDGDPLDPASKVRHVILGSERFEFDAKKKDDAAADRGPDAAGGREGRGGRGARGDRGERGTRAPDAAGATDVSGTWSMKVEMGDSAREYDITFDQKDGRLSGSALSATGSTGEMSGGSVAGDAIEFTIVISGGGRHYEFVYSGKVAGEQMSGTVSINAGEGHSWSATRTSRPQGGGR